MSEILISFQNLIYNLEIEYIYSDNNIKIQNKLLNSLKEQILTFKNTLGLISYAIKFLVHPTILKYILSLNESEIDKEFIKELLEIIYIRIIYNDIRHNFPQNDLTHNTFISILDEYAQIFAISYNKISYKTTNLNLKYNYEASSTEILYIFLRISHKVENIELLLKDIKYILNKCATINTKIIDKLWLTKYYPPLITAIELKCDITIIETLKEKWYDPNYIFKFFHNCRCNRYDNIILKSNIECYISDLYKNNEKYYNQIAKLLNLNIISHEERMQFMCSPTLSIHDILTDYFHSKETYFDINSLKYVDE